MGRSSLRALATMGMGDGASGLVRSTTQVMPRQMPPFSSMTRLVSREEMPVVTTSSAMRHFSPGWMAKRFRVITLSTRSVKMARLPVWRASS